MDIHDISLPLSNDLPSWPGDPRPRIKRIHNISEGDDSNVTHLSMTAHTGTHIDAPDHFLDSGETLDQIPLGLFIGPAQVVELPSGRDITADMIQEADIPA
ncbi:MAG: cyclase family protein, partial [Anaerolineales bacterium]|nr:cyclase family protein [Anaerolineales bacterium]